MQTLSLYIFPIRYLVHSGTPSFLVVIAGSAAENRIKAM